MDPWTGPTPTPDQFPRRPEADDGTGMLLARIANLSRQVREVASNLLSTAGITVSKLGMAISSSLTVNGDLTTTGATTIGGNAAITGTLSLPAGIIDNDALTSPIEIDDNSGNADSFTVTTTDTDFITFTIPIPAGYTRALVKAEGMIFVYNSSAVGDYLYSRLYVDSPSASSASRELIGDLNATSGVSLTITKQTVFTGLAGGVITVRQRAKTAFASMYYASNGMTATAAVWFLR